MVREEFEDDFVIDLVGYRRHGHNEGDEPNYTQPKLYQTIGSHPTARTLYSDALVQQGVLTAEESQQMAAGIAEGLRAAQDAVRTIESPPEYDVGEPREDREDEPTGVPLETLAEVNRAMLTVPEGFTPHPKLWRQLERRGSDFSPESKLDWSHAEVLALGTLLKDGIPIRMTGQLNSRSASG